MILSQVKSCPFFIKNPADCSQKRQDEPIVLPGPLESIPSQSRGFCDVFLSSSHFTSAGGVSVQRLKTDAFNSPLVTAALGEPESLACFTEINKNDNQTNMQGWDRIKRNHKFNQKNPMPLPTLQFLPQKKVKMKNIKESNRRATEFWKYNENALKICVILRNSSWVI